MSASGASGAPSRATTVPERRHPDLPQETSVVVVGGGQAGLSASWYLLEAGIDHVVLERATAMHAWADERWDSFCLVTPNWQCRLPGQPYDGDDPDGFMVKAELLDWLARFRRSFDPPLLEHTAVVRVAPADDGRFVVDTSGGTVLCDQVVLAVGGYHVPFAPPVAAAMPASVEQVHSQRYRSPDALPDGAVLVVGSGQSGAQIAEDLLLAGRDVHLAVGRAPRVARFHRGRDVVAWLHDMGRYDLAIDEHEADERARIDANHYVTGRDGGRDIDLRAFATRGMTLHGHLVAAEGDTLRFADDLAQSLDAADVTYARINDAIDAHVDAHGIDAPPAEPYVPTWSPPADRPLHLDVVEAGVRSVVWATGFRTDFSWVRVPAFDGTGYPVHHRGTTSVPGLHVLGLPWLHTWGSGRFAAIDRDARHLVDLVARTAREVPAAA